MCVCYLSNMSGELKRLKRELKILLRDARTFDDLFFKIDELIGEEE